MLLASVLLALICQSELLDLDGITVQKHQNSILLDGPNIQSVPRQLDVTDLGDHVARSFWSGPLKPESAVEMDHNAPTSNLFIVNFGSDDEILDQEHPLKGSQSELVYDFFPADSVSLLTSMATAKTPNQHGVVGKSWFVDDNEVHAYDSPQSYSSQNSFAQVVGHQNDMKIVSASSDPKLATAMTQNCDHADSVKDGRFNSQHGLGFSQEEMLAALDKEDFWGQYREPLSKLDLNDKEVVSFLMEMEYLRQLADLIKTSSDPALYNVATNSPSEAAAYEILLGAISHVQSIFKDQHPQGSSQIAFLKEPVITSKDNRQEAPHYHPKEFATTLDNGVVIADSRSQQFTYWLALLMFIGLYFFISGFAYMRYEDDATLFTKWKRGAMDSKMASAMGRDGFGGPDMRAFNIH